VPQNRISSLVTAAAEIMHVPVYDCARFPDVRFAALLVPRELNLGSVAGFSHSGEELERFDLTFHQRFWHRNHPPMEQRSGLRGSCVIYCLGRLRGLGPDLPSSRSVVPWCARE
jgi:hypothetical protein